VSAEQLIALQAALGELGALYVVAVSFVPLREAAEAKFLPETAALGAQLRKHLREGRMDDVAVDAAARGIAALRVHWHQQLEMLRDSVLYQESLAAWETDQSERLATLLPRLIAGIEPTESPPILFYGVSLASGRRHPGGRPFLSPEACAQKVAAYRSEGIPAEATGKEWWDTELASITFTDDPEALDSPVALRVDPAQTRTPVFLVAGESTFRIYTRVLKIPFTVTLHEEATDEWWQAFEESYQDYRVALAKHLEQDGLVIEVLRQQENR